VSNFVLIGAGMWE